MYIGIDVGGTKSLIISSRKWNNPEIIASSKILNQNNFENDFNALVSGIKEISQERVEGIGIGLPGTLNEQKTGIVHAVNLSNWCNINIVDLLQKEFNCFVYLENDVVTASLAVSKLDKIKEDKFIYLSWGTGIAGSFVTQSSTELLEIGFTFLGENTFEDNCGGNGIRNKYGKSAQELNETEWNEVTDYMAKGIVNIINTTNVKQIVLGGGIAMKQPQLIPSIQKKVDTIQNKFVLPSSTLTLTKTGEIAGALGAIILIKENLK